MSRQVRFTETDLRRAIAGSLSWSETLRHLGYVSAGGNWKTVKHYAALWDIDTSHFDPNAVRQKQSRERNPARPLREVMVEGSTYSRRHLKKRLLRDGLKLPRCELCGQGEEWQGKRMALILDHINGVPDDHRFENLRIVCPNCAATFDTHCGSKNRRARPPRDCEWCGESFVPNSARQRFCSRKCGTRDSRPSRSIRDRRVERPPYDQLIAEIEATSFLAVGRKYGVSDNAIRKWVRFYEAEHAREARARDESTGPGKATA